MDNTIPRLLLAIRGHFSLVLYAASSHSYECTGVLHGIEELCVVILVTRVPLLRPLYT